MIHMKWLPLYILAIRCELCAGGEISDCETPCGRGREIGEREGIFFFRSRKAAI